MTDNEAPHFTIHRNKKADFQCLTGKLAPLIQQSNCL